MQLLLFVNILFQKLAYKTWENFKRVISTKFRTRSQENVITLLFLVMRTFLHLNYVLSQIFWNAEKNVSKSNVAVEWIEHVEMKMFSSTGSLSDRKRHEQLLEASLGYAKAERNEG